MEIFLIVLVILNVIMAVADTFSLPAALISASHVLEKVSVGLFTLEYVLRLWTADLHNSAASPATARLKHALSFMEVMDLLAILPFYLPMLIPVNLRVLHALRVIRLLWVIKITRYAHALNSIGAVIKRKSGQLVSLFCVTSLLMIMMSVLMYNIESEAQPDVFKNALSGLWWAASALTGGGNIHPITTAGRALSAVISFLGMGFVAVAAGILSSGFMEHSSEQYLSVAQSNTLQEHPKEKLFCPYCGARLGQGSGERFCPYCGENLRPFS